MNPPGDEAARLGQAIAAVMRRRHGQVATAPAK